MGRDSGVLGESFNQCRDLGRSGAPFSEPHLCPRDDVGEIKVQLSLLHLRNNGLKERPAQDPLVDNHETLRRVQGLDVNQEVALARLEGLSTGCVLRGNQKTLCDPLVDHLPDVELATVQRGGLDCGTWEAECVNEDVTHVRLAALQTREFLHSEDAIDLPEINSMKAALTFPSSSKKRKSARMPSKALCTGAARGAGAATADATR